MDYADCFKQMGISPSTKLLCRGILMSILEEISYTRKDGQYLRWDGRAEKIVQRNRIRIAQGKKPVEGIDKGPLPLVKETLLLKLSQIIRDITRLQQFTPDTSEQELIEGNVLYTLPLLESDRFHGVITSPPYANRYDYTRTYALELAFLNIADDIFRLRQEMLSCTVENRSKQEALHHFYQSIGRETDFEHITAIIQQNEALKEIEKALAIRDQLGHINNKGVLSMIQQYFAELTFVFAELYRTCQSNAHVAIVNDNVRYAGEVIPVDLMSTNLAEAIGFIPVKVLVLPQRKGNSSQQMGKFGRRALRKSITIWKKP
jgi:site-specific DNA-methyltransferase (cytosine-N4-specific)